METPQVTRMMVPLFPTLIFLPAFGHLRNEAPSLPRQSPRLKSYERKFKIKLNGNVQISYYYCKWKVNLSLFKRGVKCKFTATKKTLTKIEELLIAKNRLKSKKTLSDFIIKMNYLPRNIQVAQNGDLQIHFRCDHN